MYLRTKNKLHSFSEVPGIQSPDQIEL